MVHKKINEKDEEVIDRVQITRGERPLPENLDWIEAPESCTLHEETLVARYDENMRYLSDEDWFKKQGKKDPRGRWYNKETRESKLIYGIEETVDETVWTQAAPLENEAYQFFDETNNCWAV